MATMTYLVTAQDVIDLVLPKKGEDTHKHIGCLVSVKDGLDSPENQVLVLYEPLKPMND